MTDAAEVAPDEPRAGGRRLPLPTGLSPRLLLLTILFALVAELLILAPSLASYHEARLLDRVRAAELASLAVEAAPEGGVSDALAAQLLNGAGVVSVAVQSGGVRRLLLEAPQFERTPDVVDLRNRNPASWLARPFSTLVSGRDSNLRVLAAPTFRDGDFVEIVVPEPPLKKELWGYLLGLIGVTAFISAVAGGALYLTLNFFLVRPMQRITQSMERFRADPNDPAAGIELSGRRDEIGRAETELGAMQAEIRAALASRARLAALGEAVAKINHDLRNMLSSAQLASERMAMSGDPKVAAALPRLERALDRAIGLTTGVLAYGKSEEAPPQPAELMLRPSLEAAAEDAGLTPQGVRLDCDVAEDATMAADPEQLHRILVNLLRNGREAIEETGAARGVVEVSFRRDGPNAVLRIADTGPGIPERARERLFQPFVGSGRKGGTGLGLAVSRELAQGHGGDLVLAESGPDGAVFELIIPQRHELAASSVAAPEPLQAPPVRARAPRPRAAGPRRPRASRRGP
jgi:signal transduction histidine kinase